MGKQVYGTTDTILDEKENVLYIKRRSVVVSKLQESFIMITTTNGLDWMQPVRNYLALLVYLGKFVDKNGIVSLTPYRKAEITTFFEWKNKKQIDHALGLLVKHDCIKRIGRGDYMINPDTVFSGGTLTKSDKSNMYQSIM